MKKYEQFALEKATLEEKGTDVRYMIEIDYDTDEEGFKANSKFFMPHINFLVDSLLKEEWFWGISRITIDLDKERATKRTAEGLAEIREYKRKLREDCDEKAS